MAHPGQRQGLDPVAEGLLHRQTQRPLQRDEDRAEMRHHDDVAAGVVRKQPVQRGGDPCRQIVPALAPRGAAGRRSARSRGSGSACRPRSRRSCGPPRRRNGSRAAANHAAAGCGPRPAGRRWSRRGRDRRRPAAPGGAGRRRAAPAPRCRPDRPRGRSSPAWCGHGSGRGVRDAAGSCRPRRQLALQHDRQTRHHPQHQIGLGREFLVQPALFVAKPPCQNIFGNYGPAHLV